MPSPEAISCQNCVAACCKGGLIVSLTMEEASFMLRGGNTLTTVAQPVGHNRDDVIYPVSYDLDGLGRKTWLVESERPYEPLPAGFGRYILEGSCKYLVGTEGGIELCGVYEQRPKVCQDFMVGGEKCQILRVRQGVDMPRQRNKE